MSTPTYVRRAQAINSQYPKDRPAFTETQLLVLEAVWDNWSWAELAEAAKIKFGLGWTKAQARSNAKKALAYLNSFGNAPKYARSESFLSAETMRKPL